ncbi:MAG: S49 family peptidase [Acidobacteriaceae bacterium]
MTLQDIRKAFVGRLWYVHEQKMNELLAFLSAVGPEALAAVRAEQQLHAARPSSVPAGKGSVAVIPIHGMVTHRGSIFSYFFGGGSTEDITQQLRQAVSDPGISAIVLDVDSPGGDTDGVDELAQEIYQARKQKPITAVSNSLCASAAYYLASQANELIASPSSLTGCVGVYTLHQDYSQALNDAGIKMTLIKYGENKAEGNSFEPLSDPAHEHLQEMVDTFGEMFDKAVARGRGVKQEDVHKKFGQGRVFDAKKAVKLGMADRVGTLDDALVKHGAQRGASGRRMAMSMSVASVSAEKKTKRVDGEDLEKSAFAYQGSDKPEDWHLPIEFSTEEKTKTHIRDAISRWDQTDMPNAGEKKKARGRIKAAAKKHGIDVDDKSLAKADVGDPDDDCNCECAPCVDGDCKACNCEDCACDGCACDAAAKTRRQKAHARMRRELEIAVA